MSKFTKEYILNDAKEKNVEFVRLQFTDVFGMRRLRLPRLLPIRPKNMLLVPLLQLRQPKLMLTLPRLLLIKLMLL